LSIIQPPQPAYFKNETDSQARLPFRLTFKSPDGLINKPLFHGEIIAVRLFGLAGMMVLAVAMSMGCVTAYPPYPPSQDDAAWNRLSPEMQQQWTDYYQRREQAQKDYQQRQQQAWEDYNRQQQQSQENYPRGQEDYYKQPGYYPNQPQGAGPPPGANQPPESGPPPGANPPSGAGAPPGAYPPSGGYAPPGAYAPPYGGNYYGPRPYYPYGYWN
jgi:hypothetical protein